GPGSLAGYLDALRRLRALPLELLCPGHGPPVLDPAAKLDEYLEHRLHRERRLVDALSRGLRTENELLDDVWADAPPELGFAAGVLGRAVRRRFGVGRVIGRGQAAAARGLLLGGRALGGGVLVGGLRRGSRLGGRRNLDRHHGRWSDLGRRLDSLGGPL